MSAPAGPRDGAIAATPAPAPAPAPALAPAPAAAAVRHSVADDVVGLISGVVAATIGLALLKAAGAVTGGTAGLALLLSYAVPVPFGVLFVAVNAPFLILAAAKKGWTFTVRTGAAIVAVSVLSALQPHLLRFEPVEPLYAVLAGNLLVGVGLLILFRHRASLGGFNILALLLQERLGWRAGWVQMALDVVIVLSAFSVVAPGVVLRSAAGAVVLNLVLALNHRPGRYLGI